VKHGRQKKVVENKIEERLTTEVHKRAGQRINIPFTDELKGISIWSGERIRITKKQL
jgi:hypothetical protein